MFASTYPGILILPDGTQIAKGDAVSISDALAKNAGVAEWIAAGWLVKAKK